MTELVTQMIVVLTVLLLAPSILMMSAGAVAPARPHRRLGRPIHACSRLKVAAQG